MNHRPIALFDLDGTILPIDTQLLFHDYVLRRTGRWRLVFLGIFLPFAILKLLGLVSTKTAKRAFLSYLFGLSPARVSAMAKPFFEEMVRPLLFPEMLGLLEEEREKGALLILNTASPSCYAHEVARQLGFHHCFCTELKQDAPFALLPQIPGGNNKHEAKIAAMAPLLPLERPLANSTAFSDSSADLPMLRLATFAVLIHPAGKLREIGEKRGWKILQPRLPWKSQGEKMWVDMRLLLGLNMPACWLHSSKPLA